MRAIRYHGRADVRLEELPEPEPGPGEVKLRVHANGICGSDLHEFSHGPSATSTDPHPLTGVRLPVILGHEFSGTVTEIGDGVTDLVNGELVAVEPIQSCDSCVHCRHGRRQLCRQVAFHGFHRDGGGLADYTVVPHYMLHRVPPGVSADQAALVEPLAVALRAARRTRAVAGDLVVVVGAGPIGIGAMLALRSIGIASVVVDPAPLRRRVASDLGAAEVLDPGVDDVVGAVRDLTGGRGAAGAIDAAGVAAALRTAVACTRPDGTVVVVGLHHDAALPLSANHLIYQEVHLTGSLAYGDDEFPTVLREMASGVYPLDSWVSHIALDRLVEDGFGPLTRQEAIKVLVRLDER